MPFFFINNNNSLRPYCSFFNSYQRVYFSNLKMPPVSFPPSALCLKGFHALFNVLLATVVLLAFELLNPHLPFRGPFFPIEIAITLSFLYYVILLAVMVASSIQITLTYRCGIFEISTECLLAISCFLSIKLFGGFLQQYFSLVYLINLSLNMMYHFLIRRHMCTRKSQD